MPHHRRRVVALAGLATIVAVAAVACTQPPGGGGHPTTTVAPSTTAPTVPAGTDCGRIAYASGWPTTLAPTTTAGPARCLLDALAAGSPAHLVTTEQTDGNGGHLVTTTYEVRGPADLWVTTDATGASAPRPVLVQQCSNLGTDGRRLQPGGCTPQPSAAPPFTGQLCGGIAYASGWPTTRPVLLTMQPGKCLLDAWAAGTPARIVTRDQTDGQGGHIRITIYDVLGPGQLRVTTDPRQTVDGGEVTTQLCTELGTSFDHFQPGGCTSA